jgi:hypothetical protein
MSEKPRPKPKREPKPKLTDVERHRRFVDMAHELKVDESPEAFDRAFDKVIHIPKQNRKDT